MRSYGSNNGGRNALPPALAAEAHRLGVMKAKAAARGDLRATKHYDLLLKKLMLDHGILHDPRLGKVWPDRPTRTALAETRIDRLHALDRHEVPPWFRPGYDDRVRLRLWLRLSTQFRETLRRRHAQGVLPLYLPAPSYWAKAIRPSDFYAPATETEVEAVVQAANGANGIIVEAGNGDPDEPSVATEVVNQYEAQAAEVADLSQALAAEAIDAEALASTLEAPGAGVLKTEEPWYEDRGKVALAIVGSLVLLSVVR